MTTSTLDQLLAEAQATHDDPKELERQVAEAQAKVFAVSKTYEAHAEAISQLVAPMAGLLPNVAEYESYAAPHDGKIAGVQWNRESFYLKPAKQIRIKNPGFVAMTETHRYQATDSDIFPYLSDSEFESFLEHSGAMSDWWEKKPSLTTLELAKSVIVHTVLENDLFRAMILEAAAREIDRLVEGSAPLEDWRKAR